MPKLNIVGAGTPTPTRDRWGTCFILEICDQRLMIDCGPASTFKMHRLGISCTSVHNLFFTHLHSDHISDYLCFLMTRFDQCIGTEPDLHVYGPPPIKRITDGIWSPNGLFWYDVIARTNHPMSVHAYQMRGGIGESRPEPVVHAVEYAEGEVAAGEGWTCYAREVKHAQPYIECYGFRFETAEGVVAFSGDTAPIESVVELARDADLFVMEAVHREEKIQTFPSVISETGTLNAGRMAAEAGAKRLVINHQSVTLDPAEETTQGIAEVKSVFDGPMYWARDMMEVAW
ncbi:MAG: MBL fold metallo-hydrolase [Gemmatimonadetes bacterium]|nr:MBL fold metallo-hydrolase [Gemmatimonadota bacterium]